MVVGVVAWVLGLTGPHQGDQNRSGFDIFLKSHNQKNGALPKFRNAWLIHFYGPPASPSCERTIYRRRIAAGKDHARRVRRQPYRYQTATTS
jgi:hypothetical protein